MHKKFEINRTKIKGGCQSERKVVPHDSKGDLPLVCITKHRKLNKMKFKASKAMRCATQGGKKKNPSLISRSNASALINVYFAHSRIILYFMVSNCS